MKDISYRIDNVYGKIQNFNTIPVQTKIKRKNKKNG